MTQDHNTLDIRREGGVVHVYLNRPDVRNAFNDDVIAELTHTFQQLALDDSLRAVVLGGHGKAFCAGADLGWMRAMADYSWEDNRADAQALADMLWTVYTCPVPVIARLHGDCYAGGVGLASVCDIRVGVTGVQLCLSEAKLGLMPGTIAPYVVRAMGEVAAKRYCVTAERFDADMAKGFGMLHEVVGAEQLDATIQGLLDAITANGPKATRACKALVQEVAGVANTPALRARTATLIANIRATDEGREGVQSFLNKRKPNWRDDAAVSNPTREAK
jgi:methylglutaconyl-CoA hydratase|tara:strand:+ start:617 stop:1444 length:828 start_codon:yes stop_codon:yes gene_type:complete